MDYDERGHVAMPKLVGGPRYSRPPLSVQHTERPPDPDDLPLVSERTPEDEELAAQLGLDAQQAAAVATASAPGSSPSQAQAVVHPNGIWNLGRSTADEASSARRRLGGLFRGRSSRSDAG